MNAPELEPLRGYKTVVGIALQLVALEDPRRREEIIRAISRMLSEDAPRKVSTQHPRRRRELPPGFQVIDGGVR